MAIADFCSTSELLTFMRTDGASVDTTTAALAITAASDAIRLSTARTFEIQGAAGDRYFTAQRPFSANLINLAYWYPWPSVYPSLFSAVVPSPTLVVDDFVLTGQAIGNITVTDVTNATTYTPTATWPYQAANEGKAYTALIFAAGTFLPLGQGQLKVNAKWGWVTVPVAIKNACLLQASRYVDRRESRLGVAGTTAMGGQLRLLSKLDPDVEVMLGNYRRWWASA